ncbi:MAG: alpha-1,2-fucosyltransferase [Minisyncoccota bacterium]
MIITKLSGGLGNQLFQYALGRYLAMHNNTNLALDLTGLSEGFKRSYELDQFNIQASIATPDEINRMIGRNYFSRKIIREINTIIPYKWKRYVAEKHYNFFTFNPSIFLTHEPLYITGYWQNEKYFISISATLREEYALKNPLPEKLNEVLREIQKPNSISVHIRRGDYLLSHNIDTYKTYGNEYITTAISYISKKVSEPHFFFFSDDIQWVKENISLPYQTTYVSLLHTEPHEDLTLMSMCHHNIIANSSFSWWAAWLNRQKDKIVVAPKKWISDDSKDTSDLIPKTWIRL